MVKMYKYEIRIKNPIYIYIYSGYDYYIITKMCKLIHNFRL